MMKKIETVEKGMEQHCPLKDFKLDVKEKWIYIYTAGSHEDLQKVSVLPLNFDMTKHNHFETDMRFGLEEEQDDNSQ